MYVIKSGKLGVVKVKQNSEIILAELNPGAMVGEMAFFDNKPRSASVKALKDSEVIALPYKALHAQFANFPEWCKAIMRTVNDNLRNANQRIKQLENTNSAAEMFPPHTINKLMAIFNFVSMKFGKPNEELKGLVVNSYTLRNYTIQIFQEATHKMQKLMDCLEELGFVKNMELGEGKSQVVSYKPDLLFQFVEWHNEWLFTQEKDRITVSEDHIKLINGLVHFAKKVPANDKGLSKISLTDLQNDSMRELGFLIRVEETLPLVEKKLISEHMMTEDGKGLTTTLDLVNLEKITPFWTIIYAVRKIRR